MGLNVVVIAFQSPRLFWVWLDAVRDAGHQIGRALWWFELGGPDDYAWHGWYMKGEMLLVSMFGKNVPWPERVDWLSDTYRHQFRQEGHYEESIDETIMVHTTIKPFWMIESLVQHTAGIVFDPFIGSGTTIIACERLGRQCRAIEIDPGYCAIAIQRWVDLTGLEPVRVEG